MLSKLRIKRWSAAIIVLLASVVGLFSFGIVTAETNKDATVYLHLVMKPEPRPTMDFEAQVVALTNQERLARGCGSVTMDSRLRAAAEGHSEDMALNDFFSHTGSDGSSPGDRIETQGYVWSRWGENIAAGYSSPESVVAGWMNSAGHRANILNCGFVHIGVGYYYLQNDTGNKNYHYYWTQVFAAP